MDQLASEAGVEMLKTGGSAADAAVAAGAVLAVTCQPMCGLGGDLMAVVHPGGVSAAHPVALNASGRAGSGADARALRSDGRRHMPFADDVRCVPVPGCVDGWVVLNARFGRLPLERVLEPARRYARQGFAASPMLAAMAPDVASVKEAPEFAAPLAAGDLVRRPGVADALDAVASRGREGFYGGKPGAALLEMGRGEYTASDLATPQADWVPALEASAWGHRLWTVPPNSQGYLTLAGAWIASRAGLPDDPSDPLWAHLLVEAARQAGYDRLEVLHEGADGASLIAESRLLLRKEVVNPDRAAAAPGWSGSGDTVAVCAVDEDRQGVSMLQSIASAWGSRLALEGSGIFLHNRGTGFNLEEGHPAEYAPRRRPPHTLSPALVTTREGRLRIVTATMGGDSQPQILLQLLARLLGAGEDPGRAIASGRWILESKAEGWDLAFGTWGSGGDVRVAVEGHAPEAWEQGLAARGHDVARREPFGGRFGHAHLIEVRDESLAGAADPRPRSGSAACF